MRTVVDTHNYFYRASRTLFERFKEAAGDQYLSWLLDGLIHFYINNKDKLELVNGEFGPLIDLKPGCEIKKEDLSF